MSSEDPLHLPLPASYSALPWQEIRVTHVPESSKDVTPVVVVTLYRPKNYNAFTNVIMRELETAFQLFDLDDRVKCIVLTGHGKMFCAGADLVRSSVFSPAVRPFFFCLPLARLEDIHTDFNHVQD